MIKTVQPTTSRRAFLASAPALVAAGSIPAAAAAASGISPELAGLIAKWEVAAAEYERLNAIDNAARDHFIRIAPEIPDRILLSSFDPYPEHNANCYRGHLRYVSRGPGPGVMPRIIRASYWREQLETVNLRDAVKARYAENVLIAEEFEAADDRARETAGCKVANDNMEAAFDRMSELERKVEEFVAQSWADVVAITRVSKTVNERDPEDVFRESWDDLIENILAVAERQGV